MYESSQALVGQILILAGVVAVGLLIASAFSHTEATRDTYRTTRIGNHRDQSDAAIETRARLVTGWTGDGSADYCEEQSRTGAPITKPAAAEKIGSSI